MRPNDAYFDLLVETLAGLDPGPRAQFLHQFFQNLSHLEIPENQTIALWDEVLARRAQLSERSDNPVAFQTALVDVLSSHGKFRLPVVLEYEELKHLHRTAVTDALTGLQNRRLFDETVDKELNRARRYAHPLSLVILDLHRFKEVNDKYGHPRGDEVLHAAAATFRKALRDSDSSFRIGGDEFALLLPQTDSAQASALSRRIGVVFAELLRPLALDIGVSIDHGVATYPQDSDQREQLVRIADERLYHFKHAERQNGAAGTATSQRVREAARPEPPSTAEPVLEKPFEPVAAVETRADESPATGLVDATETPARLETTPPAEPQAEPAVASTEAQAAAPASTEATEPSSASTETSISQGTQEPPTISIPAVAPSTVSPSSVSPLTASQPSFAVIPEEPRLYAIPRKAERVSMSGTNAYAVLGDQPSNRARVVDLGFGGVALDFSPPQNVPETLLAVLHVPILPPVRVSLKAVWTRQIAEGTLRVGCCFIS